VGSLAGAAAADIAIDGDYHNSHFRSEVREREATETRGPEHDAWMHFSSETTQVTSY
jgi:hypothetical protein